MSVAPTYYHYLVRVPVPARKSTAILIYDTSPENALAQAMAHWGHVTDDWVVTRLLDMTLPLKIQGTIRPTR